METKFKVGDRVSCYGVKGEVVVSQPDTNGNIVVNDDGEYVMSWVGKCVLLPVLRYRNIYDASSSAGWYNTLDGAYHSQMDDCLGIISWDGETLKVEP